MGYTCGICGQFHGLEDTSCPEIASDCSGADARIIGCEAPAEIRSVRATALRKALRHLTVEECFELATAILDEIVVKRREAKTAATKTASRLEA